MDFSKLTSNEKLAVYGSAAVVLAGLISNWGGLLFLSILAGIGMLAVVFLPQLSPTTKLPGSKGSLMAALGIGAAALAVIAALQWIGYLGFGSLSGIMFIVAVVGALVMAWAGWQELQSEGGKWQFGSSTVAAAPAAAAAAAEPSAPAAPAPVSEAVAPTPAVAAADPVDPDRFDRDGDGDREEPAPTA
jgi:hypothetical protein